MFIKIFHWTWLPGVPKQELGNEQGWCAVRTLRVYGGQCPPYRLL